MVHIQGGIVTIQNESKDVQRFNGAFLVFDFLDGERGYSQLDGVQRLVWKDENLQVEEGVSIVWDGWYSLVDSMMMCNSSRMADMQGLDTSVCSMYWNGRQNREQIVRIPRASTLPIECGRPTDGSRAPPTRSVTSYSTACLEWMQWHAWRRSHSRIWKRSKLSQSHLLDRARYSLDAGAHFVLDEMKEISKVGGCQNVANLV